MENKIGQVPEFTTDETKVEAVETGIEEVKETTPEEVVEEKETPSEPPAEDKPAEEIEVPSEDDTKELKQVQGLQEEREKLLREIQALRGSRRELKKEELIVVDKKIQQVSDELKDVAPEDISLIDRVLRSKGYITKEDASKMSYEAVKSDEIGKFLEKFPEYKPENDPHDLNWSAIQRQINTWYRMPDDPRAIGELLVKAHRDIAKVPSDRGIEVKKQQIKVASSGSSGAQRSSPKPANPRLSDLMRTHMHGWSEEEISKLEKKLPE